MPVSSLASRVTTTTDEELFGLGNQADLAGPFAHGSDLYAIAMRYIDAGGGDVFLDVWKSTDAGVTWTVQDSGNSRNCGPGTPPFTPPGQTVWLGFSALIPAGSPSLIKMAYVPSRVSSFLVDPDGLMWFSYHGPMAIATFDMATDTWGADTATGPTCYTHDSSMTPWGGGISMAERSNGDLLVLYQDLPLFSSNTLLTTKGLMPPADYVPLGRCAYTVYSGAWSAATAVGAGVSDDTTSYAARSVVIGASDRAHFFFIRESYPTSGHAPVSPPFPAVLSDCLIVGEVFHQSVSSGGGLDTVQSIGDHLPHTQGLNAPPSDSVHTFAMRDAPACDTGEPWSYVSGPDVVVAIPFSFNSLANIPGTYSPTVVAATYEANSILKVARCVSGANPAFSTEEVSAAHGNIHEFNNYLPNANNAVLRNIGAVEHLFWFWHDPSSFDATLFDTPTLRYASRSGGVWTEHDLTPPFAGDNELSAFYSPRAGSVPTGLGIALLLVHSGPSTNDHVFYVSFSIGTITAVTCPVGTGTAGIQYLGFIFVTGGLAPYIFSVTAGALPPGLVLDPATGEVSGFPTVAGTYAYTILAVDTLGSTGSSSCSITVHLGFACNAQPNAVQGVPYSSSIVTTGGVGAVTFVLGAGSLPPGLHLNPHTGEISGTPSGPGTFTYTITATDSAANTGSGSCSITVLPNAQLIFHGVRRVPGAPRRLIREYPYRRKAMTYVVPFTISMVNPWPGYLGVNPQIVEQEILDYDFDLMDLKITYSNDGTGGPIPPVVCEIQMYDAVKNKLSNLPVLDVFYNGAPRSEYEMGAFVPTLEFPIKTLIRCEIWSLVVDPTALPIQAKLHWTGVNRIPC